MSYIMPLLDSGFHQTEEDWVFITQRQHKLIKEGKLKIWGGRLVTPKMYDVLTKPIVIDIHSSSNMSN